MQKIKLFNKDGDDRKDKQEIVGGNPTGISNLNNNKYEWTNGLYRTMVGNHWLPEKINLQEDKVSIVNLTTEETQAVKDTLSFLIFLDSFQCLNLPNVQQYITAPNINNLLIIQQFQEVIHVQSYQYLLEGLFPSVIRDEIYDRWRTSEVLMERISFITDIANKFTADPSLDNFKSVLVANLILESIYFYQGFMFFDQLASRNKLVQTDKMIDYIRKDEITHIGIFVPIIREIFDESDYSMARDMFMAAAQSEIDWANYVYGDRILGISPKSSEQYVKFLANDRWWRLGMRDKLFPGYEKNPYEHLEINAKESFFESKVTEYSKAGTISGWDDF